MRLNFLFNQRLRNSNSKTNWGIKKEKMDRKLEKAPLMREIVVGFVERNDDQTGQSSRRVPREKRLYEASLSGSVESLKQLMQEDPLTLARASITCFNETPLHIAAMLGHLDFSQVLLRHKSDLTSELDLQGRSALHLASANGYVEIVKMLLLKDADACFIRDENGRTPLHLAVMKGRVNVIKELITGRNDDFIYIKDNDGNTILHVASALKRIEIIKYLLSRTGVKVNAVNGNGFTALDIIEHAPRDLIGIEIQESLLNAGALRAKNIPDSARESQQVIREHEISQVIVTSEAVAPARDVTQRAKVARPPTRGNSIKKHLKKHDYWLEKKRDALMVAATVIAAMAYQAGLNPPGGVWNEDVKDSNGNITSYYAGTSIMAANNPSAYPMFWKCNTLCFVASLSTILLLVSGVPLKRRIVMWILMMIMWLTLTSMAITYLISMATVTPEEMNDIFKVVHPAMIAWFVLVGIIFIVHTVRFILWVVRKLRKHSKNPGCV